MKDTVAFRPEKPRPYRFSEPAHEAQTRFQYSTNSCFGESKEEKAGRNIFGDYNLCVIGRHLGERSTPLLKKIFSNPLTNQKSGSII